MLIHLLVFLAKFSMTRDNITFSLTSGVKFLMGRPTHSKSKIISRIAKSSRSWKKVKKIQMHYAAQKGWISLYMNTHFIIFLKGKFPEASNIFRNEIYGRHSSIWYCRIQLCRSENQVMTYGNIDSWHRVNFGSSNGLLPNGTKPVPEPMLTSYQWDSVAFTLKQCHSEWVPKLLFCVTSFWFQNYCHISQGPMSLLRDRVQG